MRIQRGFTLIEVMIVVAIVAILAAIAIPQYTDYIVRARVAEAVATLSDQRIKMERYFQDCRRYDSCGAIPAACQAGTVAPKPPTKNHWTYNCVVGAATYTVTATGDGPVDKIVYEVNEANQKKTQAISGSPFPASNTCWVTKKDGTGLC